LTRKKLDTKFTRSKPIIRVESYKRLDHRNGKTYEAIALTFSVGAMVAYDLKIGERYDLYWDDDNDIWKKPVLIVRKGGTQRKLIPYAGKKEGKYRQPGKLAIKQLVDQFSIPTIKFPLPILDYIDGEIWIDFSGEPEWDTARREYWAARYGTKKRYSFSLSKFLQVDMRTNEEFITRLTKMTTRDDTTRSGLVLSLLAEYMQDHHPDLWDGLVRKIEEETK